MAGGVSIGRVELNAIRCIPHAWGGAVLLAATLHAFIPGLCQKVGSRTILSLHQRLTGGHGRGAAMEGEYTI